MSAWNILLAKQKLISSARRLTVINSSSIALVRIFDNYQRTTHTFSGNNIFIHTTTFISELTKLHRESISVCSNHPQKEWFLPIIL